ncbi:MULTISPECIES: hypothetical protein [Heyndrickxia]|uniref:hypothetical protein n=1 Tax=Heyndrickxia TaxID=2837504 RepID=UPI0003646ED5|nr:MULTISPECIES: hypothetical protein [Heyndrickxia]MEC2305442.1 hypothetical protein [Weizmannia sp. CD-2023]MEC2341537.1 hypothetical protein [Weizmannia sp. CD-2023]
MDKKDMEEKIIQQYKMDEKMMALIFAQWCVNNGLDPKALYSRAYPQQEKNGLLEEALALTVPKEEAGEISSGTVLNVLSLFGNDDLAFVVSEENAKLKR